MTSRPRTTARRTGPLARRPKRDRRDLRGASHLRLRVGLIVITMMLSVFGARLFQLQGVDSASYAKMANAYGLVNIVLPAKRGQILDRDGSPLAESVSGLMLVADPTRTAGNAEAIAKILADKLDLDYFDLLGKLTKKGTRFVYLARRVPSTQATAAVDELKQQQLLGVDSRPDPVRSYPAHDVAANLLGYLGDKPPDSSGGLEANFNKLLAGKNGRETYEVGGGNRIPLGENDVVKPVDGHDLKLTIDRDVQWYSQRVLRTAVQSSHSRSGAAVVLDTQTGEILSLADYPTFDADAPGKSPDADRGSRALSDVYEPGSVEKTVTVSSLLDAGLVTQRTRLTVPPSLKIYDRHIGDWFPHGTIHLTVSGAIARSSNIGTALAASQFTPAQLRARVARFGLGSPTHVGVPGESNGSLAPGDQWNLLTRAQVAFGQGLSVNALQMATAVNAIANHGQLITPSLVEGKATTAYGQTVGTDVAQRRQVISADAARKTAEMMELVTTQNVGTAPGAGIQGYRVAGKTGTAQEVGGKCNCYQDGGLDVSFAGFAPADKPRFTVYVVLKHPGNGASGGGTAGPVFRKILAYALQKYAVPPTGTTPPKIPTHWRAR